jgi:hypothetical protein
MAPQQPKSGLFVGINKGHVVTKRELPLRPSDRKGVSLSFTNLCCSSGALFISLVLVL